MRIVKEIKINYLKGLHPRAVAMIVRKAFDLEQIYNVKIMLKVKGRGEIPATAIMAFMLLKIKAGEKLTLIIEGEKNVELALMNMESGLKRNFDEIDQAEMEELDSIMNESTITMNHIFDSISNGILVTDENNIITLLNKSAEDILSVSSETVIGKLAKDCIPNSKLHLVGKDKSVSISKQEIGEMALLTSRSPIYIDGNFKGAVAVFEDISKIEQITDELVIVKEMKEKLQLILDSVRDGICVLDKSGNISYANSSYLKILREDKSILGKHIDEVSPNGIRKRVLLTGVSETGQVRHKDNNVNIVASVYPIIVNDNIVGILSIIKELSDAEELSEKLRTVSERADYLEGELIRTKKPDKAFDKFIGRSGKIVDILALATKSAKSSATVLIRGESGTGKELIAEGIHYASERCKGPFIRVNCAAIPENLIESELFGHEKGAFTGAVKRKLGKFELAQNGTIFLDEIGEMDKNTQAKILRVLQYKEFQRVGGEETIKVDVRVIAATHRNLEDMIKQAEFREDLYYRLNVIPIFIPSLKDRVEDIPILVDHFINKFQRNEKHKQVSKDVMNTFINYSWNGNVRELENVIERILALNEGNVITLNDIPLYIKEKTLKLNRNNIKIFKDEDIITYQRGEILNVIENVEEILPMKVYEKMIIEKALKKYGSFNAAGKVLGLNHKTIAAKAKEFGIEKTIDWKRKSR